MIQRFLMLAVLSCGPLPSVVGAQWELEADPFAYLVDGYSAHVAKVLGEGQWRLQLGAFGAEIPEWFHGDDDFELRTRGVTLKVDYFPSGGASGFFVGADADAQRVRYRLDETGQTRRQTLAALGPRIGYRFEFGQHLYVTPWVSVRYVFNADDVSIAGNRFREQSYTIFPTAHIGWRF
ncbi:MAG: hypothetical protein JJU06_04760 [Ectothiorhodospiraceae bacterium]|nr:hypothetical protein [Ectothiorhodospiraceae bacterium]MCH8502961.1 autotransporter outer membrane beta-barrel domain-containing protein [Ectothiorhodospiraceae bacterium]